MKDPALGGLSAQDTAVLLDVTRRLAAPFDLLSMLTEVTAAAQQVLKAERASIWLHDLARGELVLKVASDIHDIRVPVGAGLVGACARDRHMINVPDCYADARFDAKVDRDSGYRTRCALTLPLIDHREALVGVMQVLNRADGVFDCGDEMLAAALAAQCAVALQRVQMTQALLEGERLRHELDMARTVQMATLPARMPELAGYDAFGCFVPASETGGDTFDLALLPGANGASERLLVVLGDATGHGIGPALSITQMHAMLRLAFRLGASLEAAFTQVNDQLEETLADDRFITAFIGLLDPQLHRLHYVCAGQGPVLHYQAATGGFARCAPTSFPLGAMALFEPAVAAAIDLQAGDVLVLLSDGIYEQHRSDGQMFGEARVERLVAAHGRATMAELGAALLAELRAFAPDTAQEDDVTVVLLKRSAPLSGHARRFARRLEALEQVFAFSAASHAALGLDAGFLPAMDFVLEELFTNMIKYSASAEPVFMEIKRWRGGFELTLEELDVDEYDITARPAVDTTLPLEQRQPGGLGLHLITQMTDHFEYRYFPDARRARITIQKAAPTQ